MSTFFIGICTGSDKEVLAAAATIDCSSKTQAESLVTKIQAEFSDIKLFVQLEPVDTARWNPLDIALARRRQERWLSSLDSQKEHTENAACFFLRECIETAKFLPQTKSVELEQRKVKQMQMTAEWMMAFARAVEILVETFNQEERIEKYTVMAKRLLTENWFSEKPTRLNKDLSENPFVKSIVTKLKTRPPKKKTARYAEWRKDFDMSAKFAFEKLLQSDREGIDWEECKNEYFIKKNC
jgi:hypothetical protein